MAYSDLTNAALGAARKGYLELLIGNGMAPAAEEIPVAASDGRVTAEPVYARINAPHYSASAMDGVALRAFLTNGAGKAGKVRLRAGQYHRVGTGDPIPEGCDAVVKIEDIVELGDGTIELRAAAEPRQNIRSIGEDICASEMILPSHTRITPYAIGAMLAAGVAAVQVAKRPVAGFVPIGDELVLPMPDPREGDIMEFNSAIYSAMLREWGAETVTYPIVGDDRAKIREALDKALSECDIVLLGSGLSAGSEGHVAAAIAEAGSILHNGLAIRPGKPAILGYRGKKPIIGVPGHPVSGIIIIEEIVRPIIERLCCVLGKTTQTANAILSRQVVSTPEYQEFVRVRVGYVKGRLIAAPLNRGSGIVTSFMNADGIVEVPQGVEGYGRGKAVSVRMLRPLEDLKNSLVAIGSHDPMLDELAELLRREYGDISIISSNVGSISGLTAVRNNEAHLAGMNLLDEKTGEYNTPFVKENMPKGGARLVECAKRTQGLILQKGNPLGIKGVADLMRTGLRYVDRQKGSGTRLLLDYLCRANGCDTAKIRKHGLWEYSNAAVAAQIAAGAADAGLGALSAAKLYDLDFIPICDDRYDILVPDFAWELPIMQKLLEALRSDEFRQRLAELGGYTLDNPGRIRNI